MPVHCNSVFIHLFIRASSPLVFTWYQLGAEDAKVNEKKRKKVRVRAKRGLGSGVSIFNGRHGCVNIFLQFHVSRA